MLSAKFPLLSAYYAEHCKYTTRDMVVQSKFQLYGSLFIFRIKHSSFHIYVLSFFLYNRLNPGLGLKEQFLT
jgi:hypothetical protein